MKRNVLLMLITLLNFSIAHADPSSHPQSRSSKIQHVIYITLDGIRWQDIYQTHSYFPKLWTDHANKLHFYGEPESNTTMEVASIPVSLPSYQSQSSGAIQPCQDNECGRIKTKTLPEYLINKLHFAKKDVAVFSSWPIIANALESKTGVIYANVGNTPVVDPTTNQPDAIMDALNHKQEQDHPDYKPNRFDTYTFTQALHYFERYQPKFLWISLVNADDEAHFRHLNEYRVMLSFYDTAIDILFKKLKSMKLEDNTMVIVTTDHGRGNNDAWTTHGVKYPESKQTWAFVMNGELQAINHDGNVYHYNTLSIRPTIEKAFT